MMHNVQIVFCPGGSMCQISACYGCCIRNPIKDTLIHHLLVGSFVDMEVPHALCTYGLCPGGFMFQISALYDVRNPIKDTPIHHLLVGSFALEVPWSKFQHFSSVWCQEPINLKNNLQIVYVLEVPCFKFQLSVKSWTPWKTSISTIFHKLTPKRPCFLGRNQNLIESFPNNVIWGRWLIIMIKSCNL